MAAVHCPMVVARVRPLSEKEKAAKQKGGDFVVSFPDERTISIWDSASRTHLPFGFDRVFEPSAAGDQQAEVYQVVGQPIVHGLFDGENGCIFAYGQTGAGKTYTMYGKSSEGDMTPELRGIIPRAGSELFELVGKSREDLTSVEIRCSFLEVYNEQIRDLLEPSTPPNRLQVHESRDLGVFVSGLREETLQSESDIMGMISLGDANRTFRSTAMNLHSSRSHSVLILDIKQRFSSGESVSAKLNLIDLAGSERLSRTMVGEEGKKEGIAINLSLSTLGLCIHALVAGKFVPYRDSVLTRILKESLGGNSRTALVLCGSPHFSNEQDTISTLRFGARAKEMKLTLKRNVQRSAAQLERIVDELTRDLQRYKSLNTRLEGQVAWFTSPNFDPDALMPEELSIAAADMAQTPTTGRPGSSSGRRTTRRPSSPMLLDLGKDPSVMGYDELQHAVDETKLRSSKLVEQQQKALEALAAEEADAKKELSAAKHKYLELKAASNGSDRFTQERETAVERLATLSREVSALSLQCSTMRAKISELQAQEASLSISISAGDEAIKVMLSDNAKVEAEKRSAEQASENLESEAKRLASGKIPTAKKRAEDALAALSKARSEYAGLSLDRTVSTDSRLIELRVGAHRQFMALYSETLQQTQSDVESVQAEIKEAERIASKRTKELRQHTLTALTRCLAAARTAGKLPPEAEKIVANARQLILALDSSIDLRRVPTVDPERHTAILKGVLSNITKLITGTWRDVGRLQSRTAGTLVAQAGKVSAKTADLNSKTAALAQEHSRAVEVVRRTSASEELLDAVRRAEEELSAAQRSKEEAECAESAAKLEAGKLEARLRDLEQRNSVEGRTRSKLEKLLAAEETRSKRQADELAALESEEAHEADTAQLEAEANALEKTSASLEESCSTLEDERITLADTLARQKEQVAAVQAELAKTQQARMQMLQSSRRIYRPVQRKAPTQPRDGLQSRVDFSKLRGSLRHTNSRFLQQLKEDTA